MFTTGQLSGLFLSFFSTSSLEMFDAFREHSTLLTSTGLSTVIDSSSLDTNPSILDGRWFDSVAY